MEKRQIGCTIKEKRQIACVIMVIRQIACRITGIRQIGCVIIEKRQITCDVIVSRVKVFVAILTDLNLLPCQTGIIQSRDFNKGISKL